MYFLASNKLRNFIPIQSNSHYIYHASIYTFTRPFSIFYS